VTRRETPDIRVEERRGEKRRGDCISILSLLSGFSHHHHRSGVTRFIKFGIHEYMRRDRLWKGVRDTKNEDDRIFYLKRKYVIIDGRRRMPSTCSLPPVDPDPNGLSSLDPRIASCRRFP